MSSIKQVNTIIVHTFRILNIDKTRFSESLIKKNNNKKLALLFLETDI